MTTPQRRQEIQQSLKAALGKVSRQSYWLGLIVGLVIGIVVGFAVAYGTGDRTVVIPLSQGIKT